MADLACAVCGEPWHSDHVDHDMPLWKHLLFRAGKGCERCEGERPADADVERIVRAVGNDGDERDKQHRIEAACAETSYADQWVKPPDRVIATCDGCEIKIEIDEDEIYPYLRDGKQIGRVTVWDSRGSSSDLGVRREVPLDRLEPSDLDDQGDIREWAGKKLCADCRVVCDRCGAPLFDGKAQEAFCADTYDEGNSFYDDGETFCIECLESRPHCPQCETDFPHDTTMEETGACTSCFESELVKCDECRAEMPRKDLDEPSRHKASCRWAEEGDLLKCTECGAEVYEDEATRDRGAIRCEDCQIVKENDDEPEVVACHDCGDDTPTDELYENDDKTRVCGDCANIRDRKEPEDP